MKQCQSALAIESKLIGCFVTKRIICCTHMRKHGNVPGFVDDGLNVAGAGFGAKNGLCTFEDHLHERPRGLHRPALGVVVTHLQLHPGQPLWVIVDLA
jgi:hypothetical protein